MQAHDRGYDGSGVFIGILDTGFRGSHIELEGQFVDYYNIFTETSNAGSAVDVDGHGTHVAGLIGAKLDGTDVTGVAPGSGLIGIRIGDDAGNLSGTDSQVAAGVDYAVAAGAQFVNNSWGFQTPVNQVSADSLATLQPALLQAYRDAATADRVMVFSNGNERETSPEEPMVLAGLPALFPELAEHWVAVGAVGADGVLTGYSQPCGAAAAWCLVAPGGTSSEPIISAYHLSDTSYASIIGTSMAAPLVTGGLAVLKQRFPTLDNDQIIDRLFLTANKGGIYADTTLYGQGLLDLDKATDPVGPLSVVDPTSSTSGGTSGLNLAQTQMVLSSAWGDSLVQALSGKPLAVADVQGAGFFVDLGSLTHSRYYFDAFEAFQRYHRSSGWQQTDLGPWGQLHLSLRPNAGPNKLNGFVHHVQQGQMVWRYGLADSAGLLTGSVTHPYQDSYSAPAFELPFFDRKTRFWGLSYGDQHRGRGWALSLFLPKNGSGQGSASPRLATWSFGIEPRADLQLALELGVGRERNTVMGSEFDGGFALEKGAKLAFTSLKGVWQADGATHLSASAYWGYTRAKPGDGVISNLSSLLSSRFALGLFHRLDKQEALGVIISQPLRIESGEMELTVATGYEGNRFNRQRLTIDLAPQARQRDYELFYRWQMDTAGSLRASLIHQVNPGHRRSPSNSLLLFSTEWRF